MPELSEVEVMRRNLEGWCLGEVVEAVVVEDEAVVRGGALERVVGARVGRVWRRGKVLVIEAGEVGVVVHFRMTGKVVKLGERARKTRWRWRMGSGVEVGMVDQRRLGHVDVVGRGEVEGLAMVAGLGPEPWPVALSGAALGRRLGEGRLTVKEALMDQGRIAGVGNILAAEACWRAELWPGTPVGALGAGRLRRLAKALWEACEEIIEAELGEEILFIGEGGEGAYFNVYDKEGEGCRRCGEAIVRSGAWGGRSTWWCPRCQARRRGRSS